jgi:hypothetical protein
LDGRVQFFGNQILSKDFNVDEEVLDWVICKSWVNLIYWIYHRLMVEILKMDLTLIIPIIGVLKYP